VFKTLTTLAKPPSHQEEELAIAPNASKISSKKIFKVGRDHEKIERAKTE